MRIVLGLEYCGTGFCGWQSQPQGCGVQDALEAAISAIAGEKSSSRRPDVPTPACMRHSRSLILTPPPGVR